MSALALVLLTVLATSARAAMFDSTAVRSEAGASFDVTNEQYYEDVYSDTTFLGRRLQGTPERRHAAQWLGQLDSYTRDGRRELHLQQELTFGDLLKRANLAAQYRLRPDPSWRLSLEPTLSAEHDHSFGFERRELRAGITGRARHTLLDDANALELLANGDFLRTGKASDPYLLSHNNGRVQFAWDHTPFFGWEWRAAIEGDARAFPDSIARDHWQERGELSVRHDLPGGHSLTFGAESEHRHVMRPQVSSRDRFWDHRGELGGQFRLGSGNSLHVTLDSELFRYDAPDSVVDFDYELSGARISLRHDFAHFSLALVPRYEVLTTTWNSAERYQDVGGAFEYERIADGMFWSLAPGGGWRTYQESSANVSSTGLAIHSSYAYAEFTGFVDQSLPGALRLRLATDLRLEKHEDPSQDSRSLYISLDVRRLF